MVRLVVLLLVLKLLHQTEGQRAAEVRFDARGIAGFIRFTEVGDNVQIEADLQGLRGSHVWHVHELPVDQTVDPDLQCLGPSVGPHYDPFNMNTDEGYAARCVGDPVECEAGDLAGKFGPLMSDTPLTVTDMTGTLFLRDRFSIIGRSVVIHDSEDGSNFECGTIRSLAEINGAPVALLQSSFVNPIGGTIYFRQVEGEDVQMWGKMYWTNDSPTTLDHNWHIHELAPGEEYRLAVCDTSSNILDHYRPFGNGPTSAPGYESVCGPSMTSGCEVGDVTGKHDTLTVQAVPSPYSMDAFFFTDNFLNLTGVNPVTNRSVAIHTANRGAPVVACAPLIESENIVLLQYQQEEVVMSQRSPFEDTVINSQGEFTEAEIQDFAFNQLIQNCVATPDSVFSPYDPIETSPPGVETPDRFSVGALQDRYTELSGETTQRVFDVPIYGASESITFLNLMIRTADNDVSCSALVPPLTGGNIIVAKASFSRVIRGAVYLIQEDFGFDQLGNTHIIVDVYYANSSTPATMNHNWHVHSFASPDSDTTCSPTVGPHYNPYSVSLASPGVNSDYSVDCSPRYQLRCESGDMTGKHGQLDISPDGPARPTYTYVDSNLQLTGNFTVIGRSMAIHDITTALPIFDCGTIERAYFSRNFDIRVDPSDMLRTALTSVLAEQIDTVDSTDIVILNQEIVNVDDLECLDMSVRVLGPTPGEADAYADQLREFADSFFMCGGATEPLQTMEPDTVAMPTAAMPTAPMPTAAMPTTGTDASGSVQVNSISHVTLILLFLVTLLSLQQY